MRSRAVKRLRSIVVEQVQMWSIHSWRQRFTDSIACSVMTQFIKTDESSVIAAPVEQSPVSRGSDDRHTICSGLNVNTKCYVACTRLVPMFRAR